MTNLHTVPDRQVSLHPKTRIFTHPVRIASHQLRGLAMRPRQQPEELLKPRRLKSHLRSKLPQHRAELRPQSQHTTPKEVRQGNLHLPQLQHVSNKPRSLHRKDKILRSLTRPLRKTLRSLEGVKRPIDLHRAEILRRKLQLPSLCQTRRIKHSAPSRVSPPRDPYPDPSRRHRLVRSFHVSIG